MQRYYVQYLSGYDAVVLNQLIQVDKHILLLVIDSAILC